MLSNKQIEKLWDHAKQELYSSNWVFEKESFNCLIDGMILKIHQKYNKSWATDKTPKDEDVMHKLESMKHFLDKLSYKNCISHFQAKIIISQDNRIAVLEQEKKELLEENTNLKKNIK